MDRTLQMTRKERDRLGVISSLEREELTTARAAALMGLTPRHVRRLMAARRERGDEALIHAAREHRIVTIGDLLPCIWTDTKRR